jgi:hypothetical protein
LRAGILVVGERVDRGDPRVGECAFRIEQFELAELAFAIADPRDAGGLLGSRERRPRRRTSRRCGIGRLRLRVRDRLFDVERGHAALRIRLRPLRGRLRDRRATIVEHRDRIDTVNTAAMSLVASRRRIAGPTLRSGTRLARASRTPASAMEKSAFAAASASVPVVSTGATGPDVRTRQPIEQRVIERTVNRSTDPARQIGSRRLRQAKLPLDIGVGIDARDICALLLERGGPPRLHANARGPQRVAGDPGLVAGCCNPAIGRDRLDIELRHLKPDICRDDRGLDLGPGQLRIGDRDAGAALAA